MKTENVITHIVVWLTQYLEKSKCNGFVIGVSGGIDSAVTSILCAKTGKPVTVLTLPIQGNSGNVLACKHVEWLTSNFKNVYYQYADLEGTFENLEYDVINSSCLRNPNLIEDRIDLAKANSCSRLRMVALYFTATVTNSIVVGTGNKVEDFGVGFYTKYGDGGVDVSPIADLMKSEVYELGQELGVLEEIMNAPPTDGLWDDYRTDESQIGATYPELEWAMYYINMGQPHELNERQKEILNIYIKFHEQNRHKIDPIPVCEIPKELK